MAQGLLVVKLRSCRIDTVHAVSAFGLECRTQVRQKVKSNCLRLEMPTDKFCWAKELN